LELGIAKENIATCYGFEMSKLTIKDHACRKHEICHYSVLHRWIPSIAKWLQKRRKAKRLSHVVWLLEVDCELAQLMGTREQTRQLLTAADLRDMASKHTITWPGYRKIASRKWHEVKYGSRHIVIGSHMLSFRGDGLQSLQNCLKSPTRYCHIDVLMTRGLPSFYLPCVPCVGTRRNKGALHEKKPCEATYSKKLYSKPFPGMNKNMEQQKYEAAQSDSVTPGNESHVESSSDVTFVTKKKSRMNSSL